MPNIYISEDLYERVIKKQEDLAKKRKRRSLGRILEHAFNGTYGADYAALK
jgi:hypothetical protein